MAKEKIGASTQRLGDPYQISKKRTIHSANFKAKVVLEAAKGMKTTTQLASEYGVATGQISTWKKHLTSHVSELFERADHSSLAQADAEALTSPLYQEIGRLKMALDWLKKSSLTRLA